MISIGNVKDYIVDGVVQLPDHAVYVGRRVPRLDLQSSVFSNSYHIGPHGTREEVIQKFRDRLPQRMKSPLAKLKMTGLLQRAMQGDLLLLCHCHPKPCHADVLKEYMEGRLRRSEEM